MIQNITFTILKGISVTTLQKYVLCTLILNTTCLSAMIGMGHDAGRICAISRQLDLELQEKEDRADDFSKYQDEILIEKLCNRIDLKHLGIGKYDCCKSFKSAILSCYQTTELSEQKAYSEIRTIQSYIPSNLSIDDKKLIFSQLIKQHSYVNYLMKNVVQHKFEQFINVNGSTIDALYQPDFTHDIDDLEKDIYTDAKKQFCSYLKISSYYTGCENHRLFLLYLCHRAFKNSRFEEKELKAYNNSNTVKQIQGQ